MELYKFINSFHVLRESRLHPLCQLWSNECWVKGNYCLDLPSVLLLIESDALSLLPEFATDKLRGKPCLLQASHVLFSRAATKPLIPWPTQGVSPSEIKALSICPHWISWGSCCPSPLASVNPSKWQAWSQAYQLYGWFGLPSPEVFKRCVDLALRDMV